MYKKIIVSFYVYLFFSLALSAQEKIIDRVLAVVGSNIVIQSELESQYLQYVAQGEQPGENTKCKIFEQLLYQKLLLAQAEKDSVTVSDAQVESELDKRLRYYITQFGSEEKFVAFYGKSIDDFKIELRDNIKDLLLSQTMQSKVTNDISVTPSEVRTFFNNINPDSLPLINSEVEIGEIVKRPPVTPEAKKEAKEKIEGLRQRILKGENFVTLAALYSEDLYSAKKGGEYDTLHRGQFVPEFDAVAFRLKEKEISEVFETVYGFHFMQLLAKRGEVVDVRHILISPKVSPEDLQKAKIKLDSIYTLIQKDSISFSDAAAKFSDEDESKNNGGLIVNPQTGVTKFEMDELGQLDPTIVFTIDKMKPGEFTSPSLMATRDAKQAYRILYLKSRTEPHRANLISDYQKIQSVALASKQQKAISAWIKKKKESTYIKIADDYKNCKFDNNWVN